MISLSKSPRANTFRLSVFVLHVKGSSHWSKKGPQVLKKCNCRNICGFPQVRTTQSLNTPLRFFAKESAQGKTLSKRQKHKNVHQQSRCTYQQNPRFNPFSLNNKNQQIKKLHQGTLQSHWKTGRNVRAAWMLLECCGGTVGDMCT